MCRMVRKWEFISILTDNCSAHPMSSHAARIYQLVWTDHRDLPDLQASLPVQRRCILFR